MSLRQLVAWAAVLLVGGGVLTLAPPQWPAEAAPDSATERSAYSETKRLTRSFVVEGEEVVVDEREVTVRVDRTTDLRGRERVAVSWAGARPTGGRAASPYGENGMLQEYPVVILQCRGVDDPSVPAARQLRPETCWTSARIQRSLFVDESQAVWRHDLHGTEASRAAKTGLDPIPAECQDVDFFSTRVTPFVAANGTVHPSCTAETMAPEAAVGAAFPPAELAAFTGVDGTGEVKFEVRSDVENESLGCSSSVACSIVVLPIMGVSCLDEDTECTKAGRFEPGSSNFGNEGVDLSVSPQLWWAPSNWANRFSVPITFGLPPDACDVLDSRAPTGFYGSELMSQAALQWSPAYCLKKDRFKFQHNRMADEAAFALMESGGGAAAFVSSEHSPLGEDPVAYAPTAVTGFAIGYVIDRPDNAGEFTQLRLTPRLIAKLLTQSYLGSERGRSHPGLAANPVSLNVDPEFRRLNPGLDTLTREAGAVLLSLSEASDVLTALTQYLKQDAEARAFIDGKPDPWGMVVNPAYRKISLPRDEWPLLDEHVPATNDECHQQNPAPYFTQLAAPVTSLRKIAESVLDAWPNVQTKCERSTIDDPWKIGRADRQGVGSRFMLGVVSLGDAARFGLHPARLRTNGQQFVAPTPGSLTRAVALAEPSRSGEAPFALDMSALVSARDAYPGTMIVYTAARTANLEDAEAEKVAQFIRVATTEGQRQGRGNGELPAGFLPITGSGATRALHTQASAVAALVAEQRGDTPGEEDEPPPPATPEDRDSDGGPEVGEGPVPDGDVGVPTDEVVPPEPERRRGSERAAPVAMPATRPVSSPLASGLIPILLGACLVGGLLASSSRLVLQTRRRR